MGPQDTQYRHTHLAWGARALQRGAHTRRHTHTKNKIISRELFYLCTDFENQLKHKRLKMYLFCFHGSSNEAPWTTPSSVLRVWIFVSTELHQSMLPRRAQSVSLVAYSLWSVWSSMHSYHHRAAGMTCFVMSFFFFFVKSFWSGLKQDVATFPVTVYMMYCLISHFHSPL